MWYLIEIIIKTCKDIIIYTFHNLSKTILIISQTLKRFTLLIITKETININLIIKKLMPNKIIEIPHSKIIKLTKNNVELKEF